ncbi:MAG: hypothetical protein QXU98_12570 [Candidatus Parvarchaeota archaeon]
MNFKWEREDTVAVEAGVGFALGQLIPRYIPQVGNLSTVVEGALGAVVVGAGVYLDKDIGSFLIGMGLGFLFDAALPRIAVMVK